MKRLEIYTIALILISSKLLLSQDDFQAVFLPAGLNFMPLKANNQEARLGVLYYTYTTNLKVDIGNSVDLLSFESDDSRITAGVEFMAYAFSKSYAGKRLQISAVDGFFGGNISFSKHFEQSKLLARFRIIHNSAHLVDGNFDTDNNIWIDGQSPIPFTKDFGEVTIAQQIYYNELILKYYGGVSYASLIRPENLKRFNYHIGFEFALKNILGKLFEHDNNLFLAEHFFLDGTNKYFGNQQLMAGIKFGDWDKKGIVLYTSYYSGRDVFSSFYDRRISKFGIGFFVDFF
jgi:hypothetical protein